MSASILLSGKLWRNPERKMSKSLKPFVSVTVKDGDGDGAVWWTMLVFSESTADELMSLHAGDGVAASGSFKVEIYQKSGEARLSHTLFADRVISAKRQKRERAAERRSEPNEGPASRGSAPDEEIPF